MPSLLEELEREAHEVGIRPLPKPPLKTRHFESLGLGPQILKAVVRAGYDEPTPIQHKAIPQILKGRDIFGQAQTGSGKTAAYVLPALQKIKPESTPQTLILVPTRELAEQVVTEVRTLGAFSNIKAVSIIGGQPYARQIELIRKGAHVVVATPGRLIDHLESRVFKSFAPSFVVLDEADEMLDMGFLEYIKKILGHLPKERQTLLFSATLPKQIERLAKEQLKNPEWIRLIPQGNLQAHIEQKLFVVREEEREAALLRLIDYEQPSKAVVFCRRRIDTEILADKLGALGMKIRAIHGDLQQRVRLQAMKEIKEGSVQILLATDVASRGLDISDLTHVFNFHIPDNMDRFTHRIGRTGRAGKAGVAITLATPQDLKGHFFFKEYPISKFKLEQVPSLRDLEEKMNQELHEKIVRTSPSQRARHLLEKFGPDVDMEQLSLKLLTLLSSRNAVAKGPDQIGLSPKDALSQQKRGSYKRGGFFAGKNEKGKRKGFAKKGGPKSSFRSRKKKS